MEKSKKKGTSNPNALQDENKSLNANATDVAATERNENDSDKTDKSNLFRKRERSSKIRSAAKSTGKSF